MQYLCEVLCGIFTGMFNTNGNQIKTLSSAGSVELDARILDLSLFFIIWPVMSSWFKHILFMMKRIGRGLNATRALSWKEYLQGNSLTHTVIQQHEHMSSSWYKEPGSV